MSEYLRERHPTINSLTRNEARVIGLRFPLVSGWVNRLGDEQLSDETVKKLRNARIARYTKVAEETQARLNLERVNKKVAKKQKLPKLDKQATESIKKLVTSIIASGCTSEKRMKEHLTKAISNG